jgi:hypothetical protein
MIALGGGVCASPCVFHHDSETKKTYVDECSSSKVQSVTYHPEQLGFAIVFEGETLMEVSSSACMTFHSPPLVRNHLDGSRCEIINVELWSLTPCVSESEAQRMESRHLFLKQHTI